MDLVGWTYFLLLLKNIKASIREWKPRVNLDLGSVLLTETPQWSEDLPRFQEEIKNLFLNINVDSGIFNDAWYASYVQLQSLSTDLPTLRKELNRIFFLMEDIFGNKNSRYQKDFFTQFNELNNQEFQKIAYSFLERIEKSLPQNMAIYYDQTKNILDAPVVSRILIHFSGEMRQNFEASIYKAGVDLLSQFHTPEAQARLKDLILDSNDYSESWKLFVEGYDQDLKESLEVAQTLQRMKQLMRSLEDDVDTQRDEYESEIDELKHDNEDVFNEYSESGETLIEYQKSCSLKDDVVNDLIRIEELTEILDDFPSGISILDDLDYFRENEIGDEEEIAEIESLSEKLAKKLNCSIRNLKYIPYPPVDVIKEDLNRFQGTNFPDKLTLVLKALQGGMKTLRKNGTLDAFVQRYNHNEVVKARQNRLKRLEDLAKRGQAIPIKEIGETLGLAFNKVIKLLGDHSERYKFSVMDDKCEFDNQADVQSFIEHLEKHLDKNFGEKIIGLEERFGAKFDGRMDQLDAGQKAIRIDQRTLLLRDNIRCAVPLLVTREVVEKGKLRRFLETFEKYNDFFLLCPKCGARVPIELTEDREWWKGFKKFVMIATAVVSFVGSFTKIIDSFENGLPFEPENLGKMKEDVLKIKDEFKGKDGEDYFKNLEIKPTTDPYQEYQLEFLEFIGGDNDLDKFRNKCIKQAEKTEKTFTWVSGRSGFLTHKNCSSAKKA